MMGKLARDLKKLLLENGCEFVRFGKGDHEIWRSPMSKINFTLDAGITSHKMANVVLKQAGLPKQF